MDDNKTATQVTNKALELDMRQRYSKSIMSMSKILKHRFPNMGVEETLELALSLNDAAMSALK